MSDRLHLNDALPLWQANCNALVENAAMEIAEKAITHPSLNGPPSSTQYYKSLTLALKESVQEFVRRQVVSECLEWVQKYCDPEKTPAGLQSKLNRLSRSSLPFELLITPHIPTLRPFSLAWAIAATLGTLLGALPFGLLLSVEAEYRSLLILTGSGVGAFIAIFVLARAFPILAWLSRSKKNRGSRTVSALSRFLIQSEEDAHHDRPDVVNISHQVKGLLRHYTDLVLAVCLFDLAIRPAIAPATTRATVYEKDSADNRVEIREKDRGLMAIFEAIRFLGQTLEQHPSNLEELTGTAEELLQRFEDEGFEWKEIETGAAYNKSMREYFDSFGQVNEEHRVKTLRPALLQDGKIRERGLIRRLKPTERGNS